MARSHKGGLVPHQIHEAVTLYAGRDCLDVLKQLPDESVQCIITSPPYWGLRDYGTGRWEGGDPRHKHDRVAARGGRGGSGSPGKQTEGAFPSSLPAPICSCGARYIDLQLGLETTLGEHVEAMVKVFHEARRVLRRDGTLWLNYGDSYATSINGRSAADTKAVGNDDRTFRDKPFSTVGPIYTRKQQNVLDNKNPNAPPIPGRVCAGGFLKPKDLCGVPWRVAFALQEDGWYLRSDIIWSKPNPMPESTKDRPTRAHEYVFLFTKSRKYFYDAEAIKEPSQDLSYGGPGVGIKPTNHYHPSNGGNIGLAALARKYKSGKQNNGRNRRSVWEIATAPFPGAHFATFPPKLVATCLQAGCQKGGIVLDPFAGSGTVGMVARLFDRRAILIELNLDSVAMIRRRVYGLDEPPAEPKAASSLFGDDDDHVETRRTAAKARNHRASLVRS